MAETSSRNHQEFCSTEGGLFLGYVKKNNAKVAAALRRIFPAPAFRRAQSIELIQSGKLDGGILCSSPGVFGIACGEKTTGATWDDRGIGGIWYAENGDLILHAPRGRVRIISESVDLIATGAPEKEGNVNISANTAVITDSNHVKMEADESIALSAEKTIQFTSPSKVVVEGGELDIEEGSSISTIPGEGTQSIARNIQTKLKMLQSLL